MKRHWKKLVGLLVALAVVAAGSFIWGFLAHRNGIFPYSLALKYAIKSGKVAKPKGLASKSPVLDELRALPYIGASFDPEIAARGVIKFEQSETRQGWNFYKSWNERHPRLVDMKGNILHEWTLPTSRFLHTELLPNGDVLAMGYDKKLLRINEDSEVLWTFEGEFHHDLSVDDENRLWVLTNESRRIPKIHPDLDVLDDVVQILSAEGEPVDKFSLADAILASPYAVVLPSVAHRDFAEEVAESGAFSLDILHTNHVEIFDGSLAHHSPLYKKGNVLISMRSLNSIAIVDGDTRQVVWLWGPTNLSRQHHPSLLDNGNLLIFNNGARDHSQVLELDIQTNQIVWLYEDPGQFYSGTQGSAQRLDNGNTLITESNKGYVLEVTPDKEVVWVFANPDIDPKKSERSVIWRMTRFDPSELPFMGRASS